MLTTVLEQKASGAPHSFISASHSKSLSVHPALLLASSCVLSAPFHSSLLPLFPLIPSTPFAFICSPLSNWPTSNETSMISSRTHHHRHMQTSTMANWTCVMQLIKCKWNCQPGTFAFMAAIRTHRSFSVLRSFFSFSHLPCLFGVNDVCRKCHYPSHITLMDFNVLNVNGFNELQR